jgi:hypothetical protein
MFGWWFIIDVSDRQQAPPSLTFGSPLAKPNSAMDQELLQMLLGLKSTHAFKQKILLGIGIDYSEFQTYPYYLQPWGL